MAADAVTQPARPAVERRARDIGREHEEGVVVEPGGRRVTHQLTQMPSRVGEDGFQTRVAVAVAQRGDALDLDEAERARGPGRDRLGQPLQEFDPAVQTGHRMPPGIGHLLQRAGAADAVLHRGDQMARTHGLGEEVIGADFHHLELALGIIVAGEEHDRNVRERGLLAQQRRELRTVHTGHVQVHQHQRRLELGGGDQEFRGHTDHARLESRAVEHAFGEQRLAGIVFDDQHAMDGLRRRRGCRGGNGRRVATQGIGRVGGQRGLPRVGGPAPPVGGRRELGAVAAVGIGHGRTLTRWGQAGNFNRWHP